MFWIIYIVSITYCLWRAFKSYKRYTLDGVIGATPGLETLAIIIFAPLLAAIDISLTWYRLMKENHEAGRGNNRLF